MEMIHPKQLLLSDRLITRQCFTCPWTGCTCWNLLRPAGPAPSPSPSTRPTRTPSASSSSTRPPRFSPLVATSAYTLSTPRANFFLSTSCAMWPSVRQCCHWILLIFMSPDPDVDRSRWPGVRNFELRIRVENLSPAVGRGIDSRKRVWN